jgi:transcriptional regulator with XRE-family HTH domain
MEGDASFGLWLRRRRKALDLTQEALAERVGCSVATIRKIETDARRPSRQIAEILAEALTIASGERPAFLKAARGEPAVDRLSAPPAPIGSVAEHLGQRPLPTGTVTFLFTGIEGSSRLWEQHPRRCRTHSRATTPSCAQPSRATTAWSSRPSAMRCVRPSRWATTSRRGATSSKVSRRLWKRKPFRLRLMRWSACPSYWRKRRQANKRSSCSRTSCGTPRADMRRKLAPRSSAPS